MNWQNLIYPSKYPYFNTTAVHLQPLCITTEILLKQSIKHTDDWFEANWLLKHFPEWCGLLWRAEPLNNLSLS